MDVKSDFLYGKIKEEVYVYQPPGFEDLDFHDRVYKVEKALYGLHQAPRAWYETLSTYLLDNGFQRRKIDKTLFIKRYKGDILLVQVYVDDIIFGSTKKELYNAFEKLMHKKFQMSSMVKLTFFLGLQVQQKKVGIFISQDKYVVETLKKFGFTKVKTASTPMETQKPLLKDEDGEEVHVHMYRSMIGSLMYLTSSRPDIMFVVCACARYQVNLKVSHLYAVKRIFRYLKGQPKLGLWYPKDSPFDLVAYIDSDSAEASLDKKSTIGGCQFHRYRLISWQCKKQTVVTNSTTEAEYVKTVNGEVQLLALVDGKNIIINKSTVRRDLQLEDTEGIDCLPNSTIFEQLALIGAKTTAWNEFSSTMASVPQPSGPTNIVINKDIHKELGDSLVRDATTTSSLEVEQDNGNITKTRSKATPNEAGSQGTTSGGGPRCQETMGDTIAQTRVLDLEKTKTTQQNKIASLKKMVKKLEQKKRSRTHGAKRLHKGRRINAIDADEDITLVNVQDDADNEIFNLDALTGDEVFAEQEVAAKDPSVPVSDVSALIKVSATTTTTTTIPTPRKGIVITELGSNIKADHELAQRLQVEEQEELSVEEKATLFQQLLEKRRKHFAAKRKMFDRAFKRVNTFVDFKTDLVEGSSKRAGEELEQESTKKQKVDEDKDTVALQNLMEVIPDEEEVAIDDVPLATKPPTIVD
ncbi:retrovirus-related pol polyprotein from transposon TNT 1-94 [Tanacetum coccineum]